MAEMCSNIPLNLQLVKIYIECDKYQDDKKNEIQVFLRNVFTKNSSLDTTRIKIFITETENSLSF